MDFNNRLSVVLSEMDRRGFLKNTASTGVSVATGGLDRAANMIGKVTSSGVSGSADVERALDWLTTNGSRLPFAPQKMMDIFKSMMNSSDWQDRSSVWTGLWNTDTYDKALGGQFSNLFKDILQKRGPEGLAAEAVKMSNIWGKGTGIEAAAYNLKQLASLFPEMRQFMPLVKAIERGDASAIKRLKELGSDDKIIAHDKQTRERGVKNKQSDDRHAQMKKQEFKNRKEDETGRWEWEGGTTLESRIRAALNPSSY